MNKVDRIARKIWRVGFDGAAASLKAHPARFFFLRAHWKDHQPHIQDAYRVIAKWHLEQMKEAAK